MRLQPLFTGFLFFLTGVFCADIFREYWVLLGVFSIFILWFLEISSKIQILFASLFGFLSGCIFLFWSLPDTSNSLLIPLADTNHEIELTGTIDTFPLQKEDKTEFFVTLHAVNDHGMWEKTNERILIKQYGMHEREYGEKVHVTGIIQRPGTWEKFSYDRFLARENVFSLISGAQVQTHIPANEWEESEWQNFWKKVFAGRQWFESQIRTRLEFPESEYALGILLGAEAGIPQDIIEDFNTTGLRHLLALSGFNITILILFIFWIFFFLPIPLRIFITLLTITVFVGLTGASSSVVRAAVMGGLGIVALHSGRKMDLLNLLLLSLFCITLYNPLLLAADSSLQFSVLAVLGIAYIVPLLKKTLPFFKGLPPLITDTLYATLAAQIAVLPLMIVLFEQVSLVAPLANLLVTPITTLSMIFGFLVAVPYIGWIAVPFAYALLHFSLTIANIFADIPFAAVTNSSFPLWSIAPMYAILLLVLYLWYNAVTKPKGSIPHRQYRK